MSRRLTVAVPWNPLAWMRRIVARIVSPTVYVGFTITSTFPFGTVVGITRSVTGAVVFTGGAEPHDVTTSSATSAARRRIAVRLLGMRAGEDLLQVGEGRAETSDEEDADEKAPET